MKLKLVSSESNQNTNSRKRLNYKRCPACGTYELVEFGPDTICTQCEWNSCLDYVNAGLMDDRLSAYKEQFNNKNKITIRSEPKKLNFNNQQQLKKNQDVAIELPKGHDAFFVKVQGKL
jgi:hypothetical protein